MIRSNPKINTVLPPSGHGYKTYNREADGQDQVGLKSTIDSLIRLGDTWEKQSSIPYQIGDISRAGGGNFPPHSAHQDGRDADVRPFRADGQMLPTNIKDPSYDRGETRHFVQVAKKSSPNLVVLFNDPVLIREGLTQYHDGHDNHLHLHF